MNELKGPSAAHSDNLNPWDWKRERAPRARNTAPAASQTSVSFERLDALHNRYAGAPAVAGELAPQTETQALASADLSLTPAAQERINLQESAEVKANAALDLGPQAQLRDAFKVPVAPTLSNEAKLAPSASKELLEGYKERFFLKQDGYDDP